MKVYRLQQLQILPVRISEAWAFFVNPANLPLITPPDLGFRIVSDIPERIYAGMIVSYTVTPFAGIPVNWLTEITHLVEPHFFVDEQRQGPYRFWHHQHLFREVDGGTEMTDIVHYGLPFDPLGRCVAPFVKTRLEAIFTYRRKTVTRQIQTPEQSATLKKQGPHNGGPSFNS